ncbi:MAG: DUF5688 family protein [Lachnospiraceae bacterium]|nr:DUF5688 family protein [Lachnospiraceae bacterium]
MVQEYYGKEAWVCVDKIKKLNKPEQEGLSICIKGKNVCPVIYLNDYYDEWNCGRSIEAIVADIIALYNERSKNLPEFDREAFHDYQKVERHLLCRLVNYENNRGLLEELPHIKFHDGKGVIYQWEPGKKRKHGSVSMKIYTMNKAPSGEILRELFSWRETQPATFAEA